MTELIVQASGIMIEPMVQEEKVRKIFAHRLALACDRAGMEKHGRQAAIASAQKVTAKAVSKWFNAESIPRRGKLAELATMLDVVPGWLLGDGDDDDFARAPTAAPVRKGYRVAVLDVQASAGPGVYTDSEVVETVHLIEYASEHAKSIFGGRPAENVKMITVTGDSMEGTIEPGDQIFVDVSVNRFHGDGVYVFVFGRTLHIKRLQMEKDRLAVLSDNPNYNAWYIDEAEEDRLHIMGKVLLCQSQAYKRFA